jgi:glycosyltransferase involved in cell wall biosynthesis
MQRLKILHVITGLKRSGAENVLLRLVKSLDSFSHTVISLTEQTPDDLTDEFKRAGIEVYHLNMKSNPLLSLFNAVQLFKIIRKKNPDILQTWMYHADIIGGVIGKLAGVKTVLWNIRNGTLLTAKGQLVARFAAKLSYFIPTAIISCSKNAINYHIHLGYRYEGFKRRYAYENFKHIPNGIDCDVFQINQPLRERFRKMYIPFNVKCIGFVARWHSQKDIPTFLKACSLVAEQHENVRFVMIGQQLDEKNPDLMWGIQNYTGLYEKMILLGARNDIPALMNGLDILCMTSSFGEGFPNVIGEAMACGINCVATDVGDAAEIIQDLGYVAPIGDAQKIADGILKLLKEPKKPEALRQHILHNYSLEKMTADYATFYEQFGQAK